METVVHEAPIHAVATEEEEAAVVPVNGADAAEPTGPANFIILRQAAQYAVVALGIMAALTLAYFARSVLLPVLCAIVIAMALKPPVRWLRKWRLPAPVAAALVLIAFILATGSAAWNLGRPAIDWINSAPETLTRLKDKFSLVLQPAARLSAAASSVGKLSATDDSARTPQPVEVKDNHLTTAVVSWTSGFFAGAGKTLVLVFLLLASGELFMQKLVRVLPRLRDKKQAVEITRDVQQKISTYLFSIALINVVFGAIVGLAFFALGLPSPWMWGGVAALTNFVPYFGPVVGVAAVGVAGLIGFDTVTLGLLPALVYFVFHLVEANVITPAVLGRRFMLNPVVIFVTLIFFIWLWGVTGALLAVPLLTTIKAVSERLPALSPVDEFLSR